MRATVVIMCLVLGFAFSKLVRAGEYGVGVSQMEYFSSPFHDSSSLWRSRYRILAMPGGKCDTFTSPYYQQFSPLNYGGMPPARYASGLIQPFPFPNDYGRSLILCCSTLGSLEFTSTKLVSASARD